MTKFAVGVSGELDSGQASVAAAAAALEAWDGPAPDLAVVFCSMHHEGAFDEALDNIRQRIRPRHVLGCTGEGLLAGSREYDNEPALAVWLARFADVAIRPLALKFEPSPEGPVFLGLPDDLPLPTPRVTAAQPSDTGRPTNAAGGLPRGAIGATDAALIILGEPFSFPMDDLLGRINEEFPGLPVIGGMASGASRPGRHRLFLDDRLESEGAVAVHLSGSGLAVRSVVSQGCRPIGKPMVITKANGQFITQLGGHPAWDQLRALIDSLPPRDRSLAKAGLHVGRVISEYRERFERGDFLIRNLIGYEPKTGAVVAADEFRVGQTIQFHLRDADSADEDLREMLAPMTAQTETDRASGGQTPCGALIFSCNGRGSRMFAEPHHDALALAHATNKAPTAGFFAMGEIGPVGGTNFLHGFTASAAIFTAP